MFLGFDKAHALKECPKKKERLVELQFLSISTPSKSGNKKQNCTCKTTIKTVRPQFFDCPHESVESGKSRLVEICGNMSSYKSL